MALALAAPIMTGLTLGRAGVQELLRRFLIWRVGVRWYLMILLGPAILALATIGLAAVLTGASPNFDNVYVRQIFGTTSHLGSLIVPFFLVDALANGEEMGWRGFALPWLQARYRALTSSLILGFVWGVWHLPKLWATGEAETLSLAIAHNMAMAVLFTWVYNNTRGSLLIATLFHAAMNTAFVFLPVAPSLSGDLTLRSISIGVEFVAALVVVLVAGPAQLSRPKLVQAKGTS